MLKLFLFVVCDTVCRVACGVNGPRGGMRGMGLGGLLGVDVAKMAQEQEEEELLCHLCHVNSNRVFGEEFFWSDRHDVIEAVKRK